MILLTLLCVRAARAETVTYQVTAGFGCSGPCPTASTPIGAFIAGEANWAQQNQPNHLDSQSLDPATLSGGSYTANGVFHATFGLVAAYTVTGTCVGGCTGAIDGSGGTATPDQNVGMDTDWSQVHPNKALAIGLMFVAFFLGFNGGKTR